MFLNQSHLECRASCFASMPSRHFLYEMSRHKRLEMETPIHLNNHHIWNMWHRYYLNFIHTKSLERLHHSQMMLLKIIQLAILPYCHQITIRANKRGWRRTRMLWIGTQSHTGLFFFLKSNLMCFRNLEMLDQLIVLMKIYPPVDTERQMCCNKIEMEIGTIVVNREKVSSRTFIRIFIGLMLFLK